MFSGLLADNSSSRYAFIYSKDIDDRFINFYDNVIVEADLIDNIYAIRYPKKMVAYMSIGEIEPWRDNSYKESWTLSKNRIWNSLVANLDSREYRDFLLKRADKLYRMGYRNFFLDTLDSYLRIKDKKLREKAEKGAIEFIKNLRKRYPKAKIIVNRGFEILDKIYKYIDAVVAESLIAGYNHSKKEYISVPKQDREWILHHFNRAKKFGLDVISIDYSDQSTTKREEIAKKIRELGVIPYVTDGLLQEQGECDIKRVRRDILILFNKSLFKDKNDVYSDVHLIASMPIEHLGYIPILYDISTKPLPKRVEDRFHAVLIWSGGETKNDKYILEWSKDVIRKGIKVLFLNNFIFPPTAKNLKSFGLKVEKNQNPYISKEKTIYHNPFKPFEIKASIEHSEDIIIIDSKNIEPVISVEYQNGQIYTPIAITPWGGYAYSNSFLVSLLDKSLWTIDPFLFFKKALNLNSLIIPDPTTEGGRRELFVHIDGDGFIERVREDPKKLAIEPLIEKIYKKYKIPQSVSLIQGEIDPSLGLASYKLFPKMKRLAKELYKIPWIEPATHTLSHPFCWSKVVLPHNAPPQKGKDVHLNLPNYYFSLKKETLGSINFELQFAPKYKKNKKILFWSGDCIPPKSVLKYIEKNGILAMNGGDTVITKENPYLSYIAPFGLQRGEYWQIYTAEQNENVYTNEWRGPFWGYRRAIETFQLTEHPRRLKPINIYYHFYSGSRVASLRALDEVYRWATSQKTTKLYASEYIKKVKDFFNSSIGKLSNNTYEIRNSGNLRNIRVDKRIFVDLENSIGVAGFKHTKNRTYITLDKREKHIIKLSDYIPNIPYLIDLDGWVERYNNGKFKLKSHMPLTANFYLPKICSFKTSKGFKSSINKNKLHIYSKTKKEAIIEFKCK